MRLVVVHWEDAWGSLSWKSKTEIDAIKEVMCVTAGFEVKKNKKGMWLVSCVNTAAGDMSNITFIPKGMIRRVRYLRGHDVKLNT